MNDFFKGVSSAGLGALAGAGLAASSLVAIEALNPKAAAANPRQTVTYRQMSVDALARMQAAYNRGDFKTACRELEKAEEYEAKANWVGGVPNPQLARQFADMASRIKSGLGC